MKAEITCEKFEGENASIVFGPIQIGLEVKNKVENCLITGGAKFMVSLVNEAKEMVSKSKSLFVIQKEFLKIQIGESKRLDLKFAINIPQTEVIY